MSKKPQKKRIATIFIILLVIASLFVAYIIMRPKGESFTEEIAKTQDITTYYTFSGNIEVEDSQTVLSKSTLSIKKLYVKEGDIVKDGDLLLELDDSSIKSNLEQAQASINIAQINYEKTQTTVKEQQMAQVESALLSAQISFNNAETNLKRMTELFEAGSISELELRNAETAYDSALLGLETATKNYGIAKNSIEQNVRTAKEQLDQAKASYNILLQQLDDLKVYAEVDGEVVEIYVEEDSSLTMGSRIMDIINYDDLKITIKVDEYELSAIKPGKEVSVRLNAIYKEIKGVVSDISREALVVNNVSYFPTSITLEKNEDLRVGMSVEVKILDKDAKNVTTLSMKALQFDNENKPYVYYRDIEGNVATKYVTVGINDGNIVQIIDGVKSGETVLLPNREFNPFTMMRNMREQFND